MNIHKIELNVAEGETLAEDIASLKKAIKQCEGLNWDDGNRLRYILRVMFQIKTAWDEKVRKGEPDETERNDDTHVLERMNKLHVLQKTLMCHKLSGPDRNVIRDIQQMIRDEGRV